MRLSLNRPKIETPTKKKYCTVICMMTIEPLSLTNLRVFLPPTKSTGVQELFAALELPGFSSLFKRPLRRLKMCSTGEIWSTGSTQKEEKCDKYFNADQGRLAKKFTPWHNMTRYYQVNYRG